MPNHVLVKVISLLVPEIWLFESCIKNSHFQLQKLKMAARDAFEGWRKNFFRQKSSLGVYFHPIRPDFFWKKIVWSPYWSFYWQALLKGFFHEDFSEQKYQFKSLFSNSHTRIPSEAQIAFVIHLHAAVRVGFSVENFFFHSLLCSVKNSKVPLSL